MRKINLEIEKLKDRISDLEKELGLDLINNYFADCPCCNGNTKIRRKDAKDFLIHNDDVMHDNIIYAYCHKRYTTKKSYERHLSYIKEQEKKIKNKKILLIN